MRMVQLFPTERLAITCGPLRCPSCAVHPADDVDEMVQAVKASLQSCCNQVLTHSTDSFYILSIINDILSTINHIMSDVNHILSSNNHFFVSSITFSVLSIIILVIIIIFISSYK
jgi:hypothetical protein